MIAVVEQPVGKCCFPCRPGAEVSRGYEALGSAPAQEVHRPCSIGRRRVPEVVHECCDLLVGSSRLIECRVEPGERLHSGNSLCCPTSASSTASIASGSSRSPSNLVWTAR